ncbi:MAG: thiol:disulfide interchange protein DsbA/DsbL [Sulfurifustaceae bacterium]
MKHFRLLALVLVLAILPFAPVQALQKGRDYVALPKPQPVETGNKIEVREFFWYGCPHCYALEPALAKWLKQKPANVEFIRTPATAPNWLLHAQAYYAFASLGATERTHAALFRAIHQENRRLNSEDALADFAKQQGIDPAKFREAFNSFGVRMNVEKAKRVNEAYEVTSVPMLAVDGKYLTSASMVGSEEGLIPALDQLVQQAAKERGAKPAAK